MCWVRGGTEGEADETCWCCARQKRVKSVLAFMLVSCAHSTESAEGARNYRNLLENITRAFGVRSLRLWEMQHIARRAARAQVSLQISVENVCAA